MVDVEERALRALKHDAATFMEDAVEEACGVADVGADLLGGGGVLVEDLIGVERVGVEESVGNGVLLLAGGEDVGFEELGVEEVNDAETAAGHFVFVSGSDTAAGGADFFAARCALSGELDHAVIGEDDLGTIGDEEVAIEFNSVGFDARGLSEEGDWIKHDAITDDTLTAFTEDAAGNELEYEFFSGDDDGVPGVVASGVAGDCREVVAEYVDDFAFTFIAPLGTENNG